MFKRANGIAVEVNVDGKVGVAYRIAAGAREMGGNGGGRDEATQGLSTFRHDNSMAGMRLHALMMNMKCINMTRDLTHAHTKDDLMEHQEQKTSVTLYRVSSVQCENTFSYSSFVRET